MDNILKKVQAGIMSIEEARDALKTYEDLGFAKVDYHRKKRQGFPEVIFGRGKTAKQINEIIHTLKKKETAILATKIDREKAKKIMTEHQELIYDKTARLLYKIKEGKNKTKTDSYIAIISGGTSDLNVAEEAAITAEVFGCCVKRIYDVGVSGIHRLFDQIETIRNATISVVVAGMEGALPSVVGGLVSHPVIAVPTSVGYGTNFQGLTALLSMLNSCSAGISVVNIDNGFGAAYNAVMIEQIARKN